MNGPSDEERIQANEPPHARTDLTAEGSRLVSFRPPRRFLWLAAGLMLIAVLAIAIVVVSAMTGALDHVLFGYPTTRMTVKKAERMADAGPLAGSSLDVVKTWLTSRGVTSIPAGTGPYYGVFRRGREGASSNTWMDKRGGQTVAECAGLKTGDVNSFIRVTYPDPDRYFMGMDEITIYFFFDTKDRLVRHWVDVFHIRT